MHRVAVLLSLLFVCFCFVLHLSYFLTFILWHFSDMVMFPFVCSLKFPVDFCCQISLVCITLNYTNSVSLMVLSNEEMRQKSTDKIWITLLIPGGKFFFSNSREKHICMFTHTQHLKTKHTQNTWCWWFTYFFNVRIQCCLCFLSFCDSLILFALSSHFLSVTKIKCLVWIMQSHIFILMNTSHCFCGVFFMEI